MNNPTVSIVIATFNAAKTLSVALNSVINQKYQDWECIIIDGVSTDDTMKIVKSYIEKDSRIQYLSESDNGIYDAFNKGWKMAKGDWIYYLGADDWLLENGLHDLMDMPLNYDLIYGNVSVLGSDGNTRSVKSPNPDKLKIQMMCHQSLVMKRKAIEEIGGFDLKYKICADLDIVLKSIKYNKAISYRDVNVACFTLNGISSTSTRNLKEAYYIRRKYAFENPFKLFFRFVILYLKKLITLLLK